MLLRKEEVVMFSEEVVRNACWRYERGVWGSIGGSQGWAKGQRPLEPP